VAFILVTVAAVMNPTLILATLVYELVMPALVITADVKIPLLILA